MTAADKLVVDGRVVGLDPDSSRRALDDLATISSGDRSILVAVSSEGRVSMRWVDRSSAERFLQDYAPQDSIPEPVTPTACPWLFVELRSRFDELAVSRQDELETEHVRRNERLVERGKDPETYRRWLGRLRTSWTRRVARTGRYLDVIG